MFLVFIRRRAEGVHKIQHMHLESLKFIYSEKVINFCKISTILLSHVVLVKSKFKILQNFVAFSQYMNFNKWIFPHSNQICNHWSQPIIEFRNFKGGITSLVHAAPNKGLRFGAVFMPHKLVKY